MKKPERKRGRPRNFDRDRALDGAVRTFWENGFDGASMDALTKAMGINSPSLYSAFGNKHDLFMEALDRYAATVGRRQIEAFDNQLGIMSAVEGFLEEVSCCVASTSDPAGCLIANVAVELAARDAGVRDKISTMMGQTEAHLKDRIKLAQQNGELHVQADPQSIARMILLVTQGLASRARAGAKRDEVSALAKELTKTLFPESGTSDRIQH